MYGGFCHHNGSDMGCARPTAGGAAQKQEKAMLAKDSTAVLLGCSTLCSFFLASRTPSLVDSKIYYFSYQRTEYNREFFASQLVVHFSDEIDEIVNHARRAATCTLMLT